MCPVKWQWVLRRDFCHLPEQHASGKHRGSFAGQKSARLQWFTSVASFTQLHWKDTIWRNRVSNTKWISMVVRSACSTMSGCANQSRWTVLFDFLSFCMIVFGFRTMSVGSSIFMKVFVTLTSSKTSLPTKTWFRSVPKMGTLILEKLNFGHGTSQRRSNDQRTSPSRDTDADIYKTIIIFAFVTCIGGSGKQQAHYTCCLIEFISRKAV